jgi:hypothetical protein
MDFPWHVIVILLGGVLLAAAVGSKEIFVLLYRLFCLVRMLFMLVVGFIAMGIGDYYGLIQNEFAEIIYFFAGMLICIILMFIVDAVIERIAEKHGIRL